MHLIQGGKGEISVNDLKIVTLDCPYEVWDQPLVRELFVKIIDMKRRNYLELYPHGCVPLDKSDFICSHNLICEYKNNVLTPLMISKMITLDRCREYLYPFPALSIAKIAEAPDHVAAVKNLIDLMDQSKQGITYSGGWAISTDVKSNQDLKKIMFDIYTAIHTFSHWELEITNKLGIGNTRFKTDRFFKTKWDGVLLQHNGIDLSAIKSPDLANEEGFFILVKNPSKECLEMAKKYEYLWNDRLIIGNRAKVSAVKKAA